MDKVINLGIPHVAELIFERFDTLELMKCMEVSETWNELAGNVLIKRLKGKIYVSLYKACRRKHGKTRLAQALLKDLDNDVLFQIALVSETWKVLAENVLIQRWKGNMLKACQNRETKIVQLLLKRCTSEESGLNTSNELGYTPFMEACRNKHKDVVKLLLEHTERIELNARANGGTTAFTWACKNGHKDVVQLLLEHSERIELNATTNGGKTAFLWACENGHKDVVRLLLDHSDRIELNTRTNGGKTAFLWACENGHKYVVKLLLGHSEKIELNALDDRGRTGFMVACNLGHNDVVKLLLKYPKVIDVKIPESYWVPQKIKNLIRMHSMTVQILKTFHPIFAIRILL